MDDERSDEQRHPGRLARLKGLDAHPLLVELARKGRRRLPGDDRYGDPLSTAGSEPPHLLGRRLSSLVGERPSALREAGMSALQVWQALSEAQGRGHGDRELAILFTDLVDFSSWALEAGDDDAVDLLRAVGLAVEPPVERHGGRLVKRLGDGFMAVFDDAASAVAAAHEGIDATTTVRVGGYEPRMRAGVHVGTPRRLGGDLLGVDVNIAARVAAAAGPCEVLVSKTAHADLSEAGVELRRRWRFKAKGAPRDLTVYRADPAPT